MEEDWRRIGGGCVERFSIDFRWRRRIGGGLGEDRRRIGGGSEEDWRCSKWLEITKNDVSHFRIFTPLYRCFRLSRVPNDRKLNLLSNGAVESFWDALWLGIEACLCFIVESRRVACRCLRTKCGAISWCVVCRRAGGSFLVFVHVWEWVTCSGGRHSPRAGSPVTHLDPTPPHHRPPVGTKHAKCAPRFW